MIAVLGVLVIGWSVYIYFYGDPITGLYESWRQHQLSGQLDNSFKHFKPPIPLSKPHQRTLSPVAVLAAAHSFANQTKPGQPLGRIVIRRIHINQIFINGTSTSDLTAGPGRYSNTSFPGLGKVTAIAGHRTTFGAPFRHIDELASGNLIVLEMPYGTFTYRIFAHEIVRNTDWSIIRKRGFDTLVLSACHPLYSASHRWVVFARLASVAAPAHVK